MLWRSLPTYLARFAAVGVCCLALGCGGDGTTHVSGKITFNGKPVPAGKIYFIPDGSKGHSGQTGFADIKDGDYDTSGSGGRGASPGPVVIAVEGVDPSGPPPKADPKGEVTAKMLFARYETTADLPKSSFRKDIEVPTGASKGPVAPKPIIIP